MLNILTCMSVNIQTSTLSDLTPIEVSYNYNNTEALNGSYALYNNGLQTYNYSLFDNFADAGISKRTAVVLTDFKDLENVFHNPLKQQTIGEIAGNCYLNTKPNEYINDDTFIKIYNNELWMGGKGEPAVFTVIPMANNVVELKIKNLFVQVSKNYPYDITLSPISVSSTELNRQRFNIEFFQNKLLLKHTTSTNEQRALSFNNIDRKIRCCGLMLNAAVVNEYLFEATFVSDVELNRGFIPSVTEVRYYNFNDSGVKQTNADVYQKTVHKTNLLVTVPTSNLLKEQTAAANFLILKNNFSSTNYYLNSL